MSEPSQRRHEEEAVQLPAATASHEGADPLLPSAATIETTPDVCCHRVAMKQRGCPPVRWRPDWTQQGVMGDEVLVPLLAANMDKTVEPPRAASVAAHRRSPQGMAQ